MGIRYYAYSFDAADTERALRDPRSMIGSDPLADAWGMEPGATVSVTRFEQALPPHELLYLDKAWPHLQRITAPRGAKRPAHRMFEGQVEFNADYSWKPWVRALAPEEVAVIDEDLRGIAREDVASLLGGYERFGGGAEELRYAEEHLVKAQDFVRSVVSASRGFAYLIG